VIVERKGGRNEEATVVSVSHSIGRKKTKNFRRTRGETQRG